MRVSPPIRILLPIILFIAAGIPLHARVQSPEEFFGHQAGAENKLIRWDKIVDYFKDAARNSDRVLFQEIGRSTGDKPFVLAAISAPENLKEIEKYKAINRRLFDPRTIPTADEAQRLIQDGKIFVLITCSIHANEIGASQMSVEALYRLATGNSPQIETILKNVIFLLVPSANPDGEIMVTDWYNRTLGTPNENAPLPWLYHPYAGHDNNRDSYMFTQKESRLMGQVLYQDWLPEVWLDLHQMGSAGPRIFVMPAMDPINPNIDPLIYRNAGLLGFSQAAALERAGKEGIIYGDIYTYWWEGAMAWAGLWHNMIGLLTEVASAQIASTVEQQKVSGTVPLERDGSKANQPDRSRIAAPRDIKPRLQYPNPWLGGKWSLRDIVDYELIATFGLLESSANLRSQLLEGLYIVGKRQIEQGRKGNPFAVLVPDDQPDRPTVIKMLQTLTFAGVEVHQAKKPFKADGREFAAGTYVILMSQPFRAYVKDMLEPQVYPLDSGAQSQPYDITGWSLGMQMGVDTVFVNNPFQADLIPLKQIDLPPGELSGTGTSYVFSHGPNNSLIAVNRLLKDKYDVSWLTEPAVIHGQNFGPGAIVVRGDSTLGPKMAEITRSLGIDAWSAGSIPAGLMKIRAPRIALYQPWGGNIDEGWTRWILEQNEFSFVTLHPQDIRHGNLSKKYDVIIFPDMPDEEIISGLTTPLELNEFRGGIEQSGIKALYAFMDTGGTIIALGQSSRLLMKEFGAPYRNALSGIRQESFSCPGSILRIQVDNTNPIAYGMKTEADGYFINSMALEPFLSETNIPSSVVVRYPDSDLLRSGWLRGESYLHGKIGVAEVKMGAGRMILMPLRVQHRAQSYGTFKLLFNSILTSAAVPPDAMAKSSVR